MLHLTLFGRFALTNAAGRDVPLTSRRARALLAYLALSPGQSRSREEIMALLWSDRAEAQARGSLRQVLSGLRREMGEGLISDNDRVSLDPSKIALAADQAGELLSGFHLNDPAFEDWLRDERQQQDSATGPARDIEQPDIAVLPFENMSSLPEQEAFADGLTEDLITELSRFTGFTVYSPWSSFAYDDNKTTEEIAQDLEIDYVLEGSVRRAGDRVRITAMLFDAETVNHVWVQRYDRDLGDVFTVQEEVARDITSAVAARIETDAYDDARARPYAQRSAYDHVLLGERAQHEDWTSAKAQDLYETAMTKDPDCGRAYANLANWHASSIMAKGVAWDQVHQLVRDLGETALRLAPKDAVVLAGLADAYVSIGENTLARQCLDKALRQNPNHHSVMILAASTWAWLGEIDKAQHWLDRYLRLDPLWISSTMEVCLAVYYMAGRYEDAVASVARWTELPPEIAAMAAAAHAQCGHPEEAAALRKAYETERPHHLTFASHILEHIRQCPDAALVALWEDGFAKAGFSL